MIEIEPAIACLAVQAAYRAAEDHTLPASAFGGYVPFALVYARDLDGPACYGFLARNPASDALFLAVRGTNAPDEWIEDMEAVPLPWAGPGLAHPGFWGRANSLGIGPGMAPLPDGPYDCLAGHSLGAAIVRLLSRRLLPSRLLTWGEPRSLDRIGASSALDWCILDRRAVHRDDLVPHVPFAGLYEHPDEPDYLPGNGHAISTYLASENSILPCSTT